MKPRTILIVDDEANIRLMLRTALKTEGYRILEAADGRQALDTIEREAPDLMLLDLSMPVLDGMGVLQELKDVSPDKKPLIIVLTAYGSLPTAVKATRLGAMDFFEKPVSPEEVRTSVRSALTERKHTPPPIQAEDPLAGGYRAVLDRICAALRMDQFTDAQTLLMKAADLGQKDAAYFNLLGVLYEAQHEWALARKFYGKAITLEKGFEPAQKNMRRLYELFTFGRTKEDVSLGDEPESKLARLSKATHQ